MATLTIPDVPDELKASLEQRARSSGETLEAFLRRQLTAIGISSVGEAASETLPELAVAIDSMSHGETQDDRSQRLYRDLLQRDEELHANRPSMIELMEQIRNSPGVVLRPGEAARLIREERESRGVE